MLPDIKNTEDVTSLVTTFYHRLLELDEMKPVFAGIDLDAHLPHMIAFWEFVLLDKPGYTTNVFDKHVNLPIRAEHFNMWLSTFENTVHSLFAGEKAEMAIQRAQSIGFSFQQKLKHLGKL